ncbi:MAG: hypothetical protein A2Z31_05795 [candidate division NC10 bacterium RBG_16_65_8]|nr:MAG: hypothetical protein A2Z31_05795 [candidate division NC10 bacterium RBG_16_65_8]
MARHARGNNSSYTEPSSRRKCNSGDHHHGDETSSGCPSNASIVGCGRAMMGRGRARSILMAMRAADVSQMRFPNRWRSEERIEEWTCRA